MPGKLTIPRTRRQEPQDIEGLGHQGTRREPLEIRVADPGAEGMEKAAQLDDAQPPETDPKAGMGFAMVQLEINIL